MLGFRSVRQKLLVTYLLVTSPFIFLLGFHLLRDYFAFQILKKEAVVDVVLGSFALIIAYVICLVSSKKVSKPLRQLAEKIELLGKGEFNQDIKLKVADEIDILSEALESMALKLKKHIGFLSGMVQIAKSINSTLDLTAVERQSVRRIAKLFGAQAVWIQLYNSNTGHLEVHRIYTQKNCQHLKKYFKNFKMGPSKDYAWKAFSEGKQKIIRDVAATDIPNKDVVAKAGHKSNLLLPLLVKGKTIGIIGLAFDRKIARKEVKLIGAYAVQIAIAIDKANLYKKLQEKAKSNDAAIKISKTISSSLKINKVLDLVINQICQALGVENGGIFLFKKKSLVLVAGYGDYGGENNLNLRLIKAFRKIKQSIANQEPILVNQSVKIPAEIKSVCKEPCQSMLLLPLITRDKVIGLIWLCSSKKVLNKESKDFALKLANQAAVAIDNANLYQSVEQQVEKLAILHGISLKLNKQLDQSKILKMVAKGACQLTGSSLAKVGSIADSMPLNVFCYFKKSKQAASIKKKKVDSLQFLGLVKKVINQKKPALLKSSFIRKHFEGKLHRLPKNIVIIPIASPYYGINCFLILGRKTTFSEMDIAICEIFAAHATVALINAKNYNQEHKIAQTLQTSLVPNLPGFDKVDIDFAYQTATSGAMIGGDFLDFFKLASGQLGLVIGDVSGKGIEAATMTARVKDTIRAFAFENPSPGVVLTRVNNALVSQESKASFVTLVYGLLDLDNGILFYANAGHPPPLLYKKETGEILKLREGSIPLGVLDNEYYEQRQITLSEGDTIFFYTDGLVEARNGESFYGETRLERKIKKVAELSTKQIMDYLTKDVENFTENKLSDDIAIFAVKIKKINIKQSQLFESVKVKSVV